MNQGPGGIHCDVVIVEFEVQYHSVWGDFLQLTLLYMHVI